MVYVNQVIPFDKSPLLSLYRSLIKMIFIICYFAGKTYFTYNILHLGGAPA